MVGKSKKKKVSQKKIREKKAVRKARNRKRLMREMTKQVMAMRKQANKGGGIDVGGGTKLLGLEDSFDDPQCDGVGDCCLNFGIMLDHSDVLRIVTNARVQAEFGVRTTQDLFEGADSRSVLHFWIDVKSGSPMCFIRRDTMEDGNERCVFLNDVDGGGVECMLGEDKPTVCLANPLRRVAEADKGGKMKGWRYVATNACGGCSKCEQPGEGEDQVEAKVELYVGSRATKARYDSSDMYHGFCGWMATTVKAEPIRRLAAGMIFDFDRFGMEIGKQSAEDCISHRPKLDNADALLTAAYGMVERARSDQQGVVDADEDTGDAKKE